MKIRAYGLINWSKYSNNNEIQDAYTLHVASWISDINHSIRNFYANVIILHFRLTDT